MAIINELQIREFWEWFSEVRHKLEDNFRNNELQAEVSQKVSSLGKYGWELGPGTEKRFSFVISPNGNADVLKETKEIINHAPLLSEWEFHAATPPKSWNEPVFKIRGSKGEYKIDASKWEYVLFQFPDNTFDIILRAPQIIKLNEKEKYTAAHILLQGILGEEVFIVHIVDIEIVSDFDEEYKNNSTQIIQLKEHIRSLVRN